MPANDINQQKRLFDSTLKMAKSQMLCEMEEKKNLFFSPFSLCSHFSSTPFIKYISIKKTEFFKSTFYKNSILISLYVNIRMSCICLTPKLANIYCHV